MANVEIEVRTQLNKISKDLDGIVASFSRAENGMKRTAGQVDESVRRSMKNTQESMKGVTTFMKGALDELTGGFAKIGTAAQLAMGISTAQLMKKMVSETMTLDNATRKLGARFKIAAKERAEFVGSMSRGLGGLGTQVGADVMGSLAGTAVKKESLLGYAKTSGQLANIQGDQSQAGAIALAISHVLQQRGKDVNDSKERSLIADAVTKANAAGGGTPTEILSSMEATLVGMNDTFKKKMSPAVLSQLSILESQGGKGASDFMKSYLHGGDTDIELNKALGGSKLFSPEKGFNPLALKNLIKNTAGGATSKDQQASGLMRLGGSMTLDQANALVTLSHNLEATTQSIDEMNKSQLNTEDAYADAMTAGEAFNAVLHKTGSLFSEVIEQISGPLTEVLKTSSKSGGGSAALTAGGIAATGLGGTILGMLGKSLLGKLAPGLAGKLFGAAAVETGAGALGVGSTGGIIGGSAVTGGAGIAAAEGTAAVGAGTVGALLLPLTAAVFMLKEIATSLKDGTSPIYGVKRPQENVTHRIQIQTAPGSGLASVAQTSTGPSSAGSHPIKGRR